MDDNKVVSTSGYSWGKSRHLFHRRSDRSRINSFLEQSVCFIFHLIAIAVRCPCLQPAETFGVDASGKMVLDPVAPEIFAPGDYCLLKPLAALRVRATLCDQLFQARMLLGRPLRGALSTVAAPSHGLYRECDMGSREPDQRLIAAVCKGGGEARDTDARLQVPKRLCKLGKLIGEVGQITSRPDSGQKIADCQQGEDVLRARIRCITSRPPIGALQLRQ